MELIQSNKGGQKLCRNGYIYKKKSRSNSSIFWCCVKQTMGCKATLRTTVEIMHPIESKKHNHAPDNNEISVAKARTVMKLQAQTTHDKPGLVYANSVAHVEEATMAHLPSVETCKKTIRNQWDPEFPAVPALLQDLIIEGEWTQTLDNQRYLLFDNGPDAESRIIAFSSNSQLQLLLEARSWMMDGSFAMAPPLFSQLYSVRVPLSESTIAVAFAFLQHKMQSTYEELFQGLLQQLPNPESVIIDYEIAVIQAVNSIIGEHVEIQGCFYHLTQSTWRRVQSLGLTEMYKNSKQFKHFCGMLDGLAFLPVGDVTAGMEFLNRIAMPKAAGLVDYFDSTYVNGTYLQLQQRRLRPRFPPPVWNVMKPQLTVLHERIISAKVGTISLFIW